MTRCQKHYNILPTPNLCMVYMLVSPVWGDFAASWGQLEQDTHVWSVWWAVNILSKPLHLWLSQYRKHTLPLSCESQHSLPTAKGLFKAEILTAVWKKWPSWVPGLRGVCHKHVMMYSLGVRLGVGSVSNLCLAQRGVIYDVTCISHVTVQHLAAHLQ